MKTMITKTISTVLVTAMVAITANAQMSGYKFKQQFDRAFGLIMEAEYQTAIPILEKLNNADENHGQVAFLLGMCQVRTGQVSHKTQEVLKSASSNFNYYHQRGLVEDRTSPAKVWYYLAEASAENNQFDAAIEAYKNYMSCIPMASLDHKREIVFAIRALRQEKEAAQAGVVSMFASQKP